MLASFTRALSPTRFALFLSPLLLSCSTVPIPNSKEGTVAGVVQAGMDFAETNTGKIHELSMQEMFDFLEPQNARRCVPVPGFNVCADDQTQGQPVDLPARAGALCRSDDDFTAQKIAVEQACALLKNRCTPEMKEEISRVYGNSKQLLKNSQRKKTEVRINEAFDLEHVPVEDPQLGHHELPLL